MHLFWDHLCERCTVIDDFIWPNYWSEVITFGQAYTSGLVDVSLLNIHSCICQFRYPNWPQLSLVLKISCLDSLANYRNRLQHMISISEMWLASLITYVDPPTFSANCITKSATSNVIGLSSYFYHPPQALWWPRRVFQPSWTLCPLPRN